MKTERRLKLSACDQKKQINSADYNKSLLEKFGITVSKDIIIDGTTFLFGLGHMQTLYMWAPFFISTSVTDFIQQGYYKTRVFESNMDKKIKYVYKYKAVNTKEDLIRTIDILDGKRIFMPKYSQLNDPLEGQIDCIDIPKYCGYSMHEAADIEDPILLRYKDEFRILSFSNSPYNPQLWAHYGGNYEGICFCFSTENSFKDCLPVSYCKERNHVDAYEYGKIEKCVVESFFKKSLGWAYEEELRIVKKDCGDPYLKYTLSELKAVIFGHKMPEETRSFIERFVDNNVKKYKTGIGYRSFKVNILNYDYEYFWDGGELKTVDLEEEL